MGNAYIVTGLLVHHDSNTEDKRPNCRSKNLIYESVCLDCIPPVPTSQQEVQGSEPISSSARRLEDKPRKGVYIGETSRSLHERSFEHLQDAKSFHIKSHMVKHWMIEHPEKTFLPTFKFSIVAQYRDCLSRQIGEAIKILYSKDHLLNSKTEYMNNCLTRIAIPEENWEKNERKRRESEEERL